MFCNGTLSVAVTDNVTYKATFPAANDAISFQTIILMSIFLCTRPKNIEHVFVRIEEKTLNKTGDALKKRSEQKDQTLKKKYLTLKKWGRM